MTKAMRFIDSYDYNKASQKGYRRSYSVEDEESGKQLAHCDLFGYFESSTVQIINEHNLAYSISPNRKVLPSKWTLRDDNRVDIYEIERASVAKLFNPLGRKILSIRNLTANKVYELTNLTDSKLDLMFGPASTTWYLLENGNVVAGFQRKKAPKQQLSNGVLSKLKEFFQPSFWVMQSQSPSHLISGPAFLALMILFESHTRSAG